MGSIRALGAEAKDRCHRSTAGLNGDSVSPRLCLLAGHGLWNGTFREHPPFDVPDATGSFPPLALGGFYMFLTMIILLQVGRPPSLGAYKALRPMPEQAWEIKKDPCSPKKELTGPRPGSAQRFLVGL